MLVYYLLYVMKYNYDETVLFQAKHIILVAFKNYLKQLMAVNNEILLYLLTASSFHRLLASAGIPLASLFLNSCVSASRCFASQMF